MFNILHPQRLVAVSSSSFQQICEEAFTGKNKKVKTVKLPVERERVNHHVHVFYLSWSRFKMKISNEEVHTTTRGVVHLS